MDISSKDHGLVEGYLSECEDENRTLDWKLSEATKEIERLRAALEHIRDVATGAALGKHSGVDHFWYGEEVTRVLADA